ncbi:uncharacterized protein METZ01_LOCUS259032, partial [marine metagenome]
ECTWLEEQSFIVTDASDGNTVYGEGIYNPLGPTCFSIGADYECDGDLLWEVPLPDLAVTGVTYNNWTGRAIVTVENIGSVDSEGFYVMAYLDEPDSTTGNSDNGHFQYYYVSGGIASGSSMDIYLSDYLTLPEFVGSYDDETYTLYAMADGLTSVYEDREDNNIGSTTVVNSHPLANSSWNVYRSEAGGDPALAFNVTLPDDWFPDSLIEAVDEDVTGEVEYCYTVTQVDGDSESDESGPACATPASMIDLPVPQNVTGTSDGWYATVEWDHPDLTDFGSAMGQVSVTDEFKLDDPSSFRIYDQSAYPDQTRQGGDTVDDAVVINSVPYSDAGTTSGYTNDYDEECPYVGS